MIGVDVRGENRFDAKSEPVCEFDVLSDLKLRIDDRRAALTASTDKVRRATSVGFEELAKNHNDVPSINSERRTTGMGLTHANGDDSSRT
jgi:hypothetical protein